MSENNGSMFDLNNNNNQQQSFNPQQGFNQGQNFDQQQDFNQGQNFNQQGFNQGQNFNQQQGFNQGQNFNQQQGFNQGQNFNMNYPNPMLNNKRKSILPVVIGGCLLIVVVGVFGVTRIMHDIGMKVVDLEAAREIDKLPTDVIDDGSGSTDGNESNEDSFVDDNTENNSTSAEANFSSDNEVSVTVGGTVLYLPLDYFTNKGLNYDYTNSSDTIIFFDSDDLKKRISYSDSFIDIGDNERVEEAFLDVYYGEGSTDAYECYKNSQEVDGKMIYYVAKAYKDSSIMNVHLLQDIGLGSYLEVEINDEESDFNIPNLVNQFLIDTTQLNYR